MPTTATHNGHATTTARVLFVAFARREKTWKLGCTTGHGQKPCARPVAARHQACVLQAVALAKSRFGLSATAPVVSGDAAGREGFWLHRLLPAHGLTNPGVDAASIAVPRRTRRAKSEGWDVRKLLRMLRRFQHGARDVWRVVHGPAGEAEDKRPRHRDLETLKQERARTTTRLKGLRRSQGIRLTSLRQFAEPLDALRLWDGASMPRGLRRRVLRVYAHDPCLSAQIAELEAERRAVRQSSQDARIEPGRQLMQLQGIGIHGAGVVVRALFGGRALKHRREVGA